MSEDIEVLRERLAKAEHDLKIANNTVVALMALIKNAVNSEEEPIEKQLNNSTFLGVPHA